MKITSSVTIEKEIDIVVSMICNKCGKEHESDEDNEFTDIHKVNVQFEGEYNHYRSKCWWFDLCDHCLIDIVKTFRHVPEWFIGSPSSDYSQQKFNEWVVDGCKPMSRF